MNEATTTTVAHKVITVGVLGANGGVALTGNEVLTAAGLENLVFMGVTYGAWVMIILFASLVMLAMLRLKDLWFQILKPLGAMLASYKKEKASVKTGNDSKKQ